MTVHPVDQTNIVPGSDVSFSVTATGTVPLSYQWQKDGVNLTDGGSITGATTATLTITGVMESDEGGYSCVVTNTAGTDKSNTAILAFGKLNCMCTFLLRTVSFEVHELSPHILGERAQLYVYLFDNPVHDIAVVFLNVNTQPLGNNVNIGFRS